MISLCIVYPLLSHLPQPQSKRHRPMIDKLRKSPEGDHLSFLHDVRGVEPGLKSVIQTERNQSAEPRSMQLEQSIESLPVSLCGKIEESDCLT
jgi:hypothetical protein